MNTLTNAHDATVAKRNLYVVEKDAFQRGFDAGEIAGAEKKQTRAFLLGAAFGVFVSVLVFLLRG